MKFFVSCLIVLAVSAFVVRAEIRPFTYVLTGSSLATPTQQQYHSQDDFGQYSYGYIEPLSAKQEIRSLDGITRGSYSYRDAEGKLQTVDYTADDGGFRVAATNLPKAVPIPEYRPEEAPTPITDTVEVASARAAHLAAHQEARLRLAKVATINDESVSVESSDSSVELPQPVDNTSGSAVVKSVELKPKEVTFTPTNVFRTVSPYIPAYQPSVFPRFGYGYGYGYVNPLNTRFLATPRFFY